MRTAHVALGDALQQLRDDVHDHCGGCDCAAVLARGLDGAISEWEALDRAIRS